MSGKPPLPTDTFLAEAEDLLIELEASLLDLESTPDNAEEVHHVFRALHTIKGSGAMFGFQRVADFTHHVETAFQRVRDGDLAASAGLVSLTLSALDHIRLLLNGGEDTDKEQRLLEGFAAALAETPDQAPRTMAGGGDPGGQAEGDTAQAETTTWRIRLRLGRQAMAFGVNPLRLLDELRDLGDCIVVGLTDRVPPLQEMEPESCYMEWDILLATSRPRSAIDDVFLFVADDGDISIEPLAGGEDLPRLGEILIARGDISAEAVEDILQQQRPLGQMLVDSGQVSPDRVLSALVEQKKGRETAAPKQAAAPDAGGPSSIRVQAERLDSLMDQVGELVIAQARLSQLAASSTDINLRSVAEEIERLSSDLRETTMGIRMVPIGSLFGRFRRVVRDLSQSLGKTVDLTMEGEDSELDKTVIERLNDPLVHLIRNSIDHGIESATTRRAHGKPEHGRLHLAAVHSGTQVLISVSDDGAGLDRAAIRAKAEERGLIAPDATLTDGELLALIFHPGFSTSSQVSSVSGRGVGMDVVKRTIDALRGSIDVTSTPGEGATVTLKLPLTLAIIDGLLVRVGDGHYVLPLSAVEECVELTPEDDAEARHCNFLNIRGALVPFLRLRHLFAAQDTPAPFPKVVVVSAGRLRVGLVVDQVVGQHQTVIKSMSKLLDDVHEFSGATILGDGTVALILDVPRLVQLGQRDADTQRQAS